MKTIPKELTPELLSLVLDEEVKTFTSNGVMLGINPTQRRDKPASCVVCSKHINLDTLGRLCKEWCYKQGVSVINVIYTNVGNKKPEIQVDMRLNEDWMADRRYTEIEAIIKATVWVAEEKGLI